MATVHVISGGAAQGLVKALAPRLANDGISVEGTYGAVGAMRDRLVGGAPCDLVILTEALVRELQQQGHVLPGTSKAIGRVRTGIAVKAGEAMPQVADGAALKALLERASAIYCPDTVKSTAGQHFLKVLRALGLEQAAAGRLREFPNGATAMGEMAANGPAGSVGCTQVTEILYTPGVQLAGGLPPEFELATVYTAAIGARAESPQAAGLLADLLVAPDAADLRARGGFDPL